MITSQPACYLQGNRDLLQQLSCILSLKVWQEQDCHGSTSAETSSIVLSSHQDEWSYPFAYLGDDVRYWYIYTLTQSQSPSIY